MSTPALIAGTRQAGVVIGVAIRPGWLFGQVSSLDEDDLERGNGGGGSPPEGDAGPQRLEDVAGELEGGANAGADEPLADERRRDDAADEGR